MFWLAAAAEFLPWLCKMRPKIDIFGRTAKTSPGAAGGNAASARSFASRDAVRPRWPPLSCRCSLLAAAGKNVNSL